jgi:hypothetical protein
VRATMATRTTFRRSAEAPAELPHSAASKGATQLPAALSGKADASFESCKRPDCELLEALENAIAAFH